MLFELPPHQLELRRGVIAVFTFRATPCFRSRWSWTTSAASVIWLISNSLPITDTRIEHRKQHIREEGAQNRQGGIDEQDGPGQIGVLVEQRGEEELPYPARLTQTKRAACRQ